jgi:hypothetical protein
MESREVVGVAEKVGAQLELMEASMGSSLSYEGQSEGSVTSFPFTRF